MYVPSYLMHVFRSRHSSMARLRFLFFAEKIPSPSPRRSKPCGVLNTTFSWRHLYCTLNRISDLSGSEDITRNPGKVPPRRRGDKRKNYGSTGSCFASAAGRPTKIKPPPDTQRERFNRCELVVGYAIYVWTIYVAYFSTQNGFVPPHVILLS